MRRGFYHTTVDIDSLFLAPPTELSIFEAELQGNLGYSSKSQIINWKKFMIYGAISEYQKSKKNNHFIMYL